MSPNEKYYKHCTIATHTHAVRGRRYEAGGLQLKDSVHGRKKERMNDGRAVRARGHRKKG